MTEFNREVGDASVPLSIFILDSSGAPATGQTVTAAVRRESDGQFLDFDDNTFKASGHVEQNKTLAELTGEANTDGIYQYLWDSSAPVTVPAAFTVHFNWTDQSLRSALCVKFDYSLLSQRILRNRLEIDTATGELRLYDDAGTSVTHIWTLTDKSSNPATLADLANTLPANRGQIS